LPRLRDPAFTRVFICALAEATQAHEAANLQEDLRRAGIEPFAWIINQSLAPLGVHDPVLLSRKAQETKYIAEVMQQHAGRTLLGVTTSPDRSLTIRLKISIFSGDMSEFYPESL